MNDDMYFSERELGSPNQDQEEIGQQFWNGFVALIKKSLLNGLLAQAFPLHCSAGPLSLVIGCDKQLLGLTLHGDFPSIAWPLEVGELPQTLTSLDLIEFFCRYVSQPEKMIPHSYGRHVHLSSFNREAGLQSYQKEVNHFFRSSKLAYELQSDCRVQRLGPPVLRDILAGAVFRSEDQELNRLLEDAREKIGDPDLNIRRDAIEKLWDAWERLKTLEGDDKKQAINALLIKAIPQEKLRPEIDKEAQALTNIGNNFRIRHSEENKPIISDAESLDYLFYRLFALMHLYYEKQIELSEAL